MPERQHCNRYWVAQAHSDPPVAGLALGFRASAGALSPAPPKFLGLLGTSLHDSDNCPSNG
jgi:hypothetical protein